MDRDQQRPPRSDAEAVSSDSHEDRETNDASATDVAAKLVGALDRLARAQRQHRQAAASRLGITPLQVDVLRTLHDGPPPDAVVGLIARELGVSQPTVTDSVSALERKGFVNRRRSEDDQRRIKLELTSAGQSLVAQLDAAESEVIAAVAGMSTGRQETAFVVLLELIQRFVETGLIEVARTCLTCAYLGGDQVSGRRCLLLDMALPDDALRVNCPEHRSADAD